MPLLFLGLMAMAQAQAVEPVGDDIHSIQSGSFEMCGYTVPNVGSYETAVRLAGGLEELPSTVGYTSVLVKETGAIITFTTPENRAYPAAICRNVVEAEDGGSTIDMQIICGADRESCDWLFWEFKAWNERIIDEAGQ